MSRTHFISFACLGALGLAGCHFDLKIGGSTEGIAGAVDFSYSDWNGCFLGCAVDKPMLLDTVERLSIRPHETELGLVAVSSNPSVMSVELESSESCCHPTSGNSQSCESIELGAACSGEIRAGYSATVRALGAGTADLVMRHADGSELDRVALAVTPAASVTLECSPGLAPGGVTLGLAAGGQCTFRASAQDSEGNELQATRGFVLSVSDASILALREDAFIVFFPEDLTTLDEATGFVRGQHAGTAALTLRAGSVAHSIAVSVQ